MIRRILRRLPFRFVLTSTRDEWWDELDEQERELLRRHMRIEELEVELKAVTAERDTARADLATLDNAADAGTLRIVPQSAGGAGTTEPAESAPHPRQG